MVNYQKLKKRFKVTKVRLKVSGKRLKSIKRVKVKLKSKQMK